MSIQKHTHTSPLMCSKELLSEKVPPFSIEPGGLYTIHTSWPGDYGPTLVDTLYVHPEVAKHLVFCWMCVGGRIYLKGPIPMSILQEARIMSAMPILPRQEVSITLRNTFDDTICVRAEWVFAQPHRVVY